MATEALLESMTLPVAVQVNGRTRGVVQLSAEATQGQLTCESGAIGHWIRAVGSGHAARWPTGGSAGDAIEECEPVAGLRIDRITVELLRPVPVGDVVVQAQVVRPGRRVRQHWRRDGGYSSLRIESGPSPEHAPEETGSTAAPYRQAT